MEPHFSRDFETGKIEPRFCPMCTAQMASARISPARLGINSRTFECLQCNHVEKVLESADPIQSNVLGWLFGELKAPS
ncbi:MAG: response regulator [Bradyrhizobium sp.]